MKTKINGYRTSYHADDGKLLLVLNGKLVWSSLFNSRSLKDIESYAKQLLEAVEAAKLVVNMNEKG